MTKIINRVTEPQRETTIARDVDVVVCGGGPAGVSAALAAAAGGARTVLLETGGCLGGVWTAGLLGYILDAKPESPVTRLLVDELDRLGGEKRLSELSSKVGYAWAKNSFIYDPEAMKWVLERECLRLGVIVQLHTRVCAVVREGKQIQAVLTESKSGRQAWTAKVVIDATGDGDVAAQAGCSFEVGRPGSGEVQPLSLMCLVTTPFPERLKPLAFGGGTSIHKAIAAAGLKLSYGAPVLFRVRDDLYAFMMNHRYGSALDAAELTRATFEARTEINETVRTLRAQGGAWEGLQVEATAPQIGAREGRRVKGRAQVTVDDLVAGTVQADGICRVTFPIDVHSTSKESGEAFDAENKIKSLPYDIPLRALMAADVDNLLLAGRCISGDFLAHSSYRVTGNAVATGEAAGTLAAAATKHALTPAAVAWSDFQTVSRELAGRLVPAS